MAKAPKNPVTAGDVQDLAIAVEQLTEEARLLRMSLDELLDDVIWAARQVLTTGYQASGTAAPMPNDAFAHPGSTTPVTENGSGHSREVNEGGEYCCVSPRLTWSGDPDAPGVACENCGYVIAENGSVVIWRDEASEPESTKAERQTEPEQRQGNLF